MSVMQESTPSPGRSRRRFTKEFKADAVALALDGDRSIASALGLTMLLLALASRTGPKSPST